MKQELNLDTILQSCALKQLKFLALSGCCSLFFISETKFMSRGMRMLMLMPPLGLFIVSFLPYIGIYFRAFVYWLTLGVISTVGLGTGYHTGTFFLTPKILANPDDVYNNLGATLAWGIGTAVGEIPPYFLAKRYLSTQFEKLREYRVNKIMIRALEKYGCPAILFFASYPNMFFDLCGLVCGYYNYKFLYFFVPTLIGKAFIKAPVQLLILTYLARNASDYELYKDYFANNYISISIPMAEYLVPMMTMLISLVMVKKILEDLANSLKGDGDGDDIDTPLPSTLTPRHNL